MKEGRGLTIRHLSSLEDYEACTEFQEEVWGRGFSERVSGALLMIANRIGGLAAGAFDETGMLRGFVFGLTGVVDGELVHWSDMLAVRDGVRDRGLGTRLKWYQRQEMLGLGVKLMQWTFDPLQGRNAHVNLNKLGTVCREYVQNMYGNTDSPLHRGVGTDRLIAVWELDSERVRERLEGGGGGSVEPLDVGGAPAVSGRDGLSAGLPEILPIHGDGDLPMPGEPLLGMDAPRLLLPIPTDIGAFMEDDMPSAVRWREATRDAFLHYLPRGYEVRGFIRGGWTSSYLLVASGEDHP